MFLSIVGLILLVNIVVWFVRKLRIGNYANRYVFITGCDTGFGNMLAKKLDSLGFCVFAGCLTETGQEEIRASCSDRVLPVAIDVAKETSIEEAMREVKRRLPDGKGLWAIVNNAGISGSIGPTRWQTRQDYLDCMNVNLFGVIFVTKSFLPLVAMEKGRVVNMSSAAGRISTFPVYAISKFGVEAFSDCLRYEMYNKGVSVHILEPGYFSTPITARLESNVTAKVNSLPPAIRETISDSQMNKALDEIPEILAGCSKQTFMVVDAYTHAITARFPKVRYQVGNDCKYIFRPLWMLPEWISDYIIANMFMKLQF